MKYYLVIFIMLIASVSAFDNIGTYKLNTPMNINLGCSINNTFCPSSFSCNITVYNEEGLKINNVAMSSSSFPTYSYTLNATTLNKTGLWYGRQVCCSSSECQDYSFEFEVNAQGKQYNTTIGIVYIILMGILLVVFIMGLYFSFTIEWTNVRSDEGTTIKVNWGKYWKLLIIGITYLSFIAITYLCYNLGIGILEFNSLGNFFYALFRISYVLAIPTLAIIFVFGLTSLVSDKNIDKYIKRGLTVK